MKFFISLMAMVLCSCTEIIADEPIGEGLRRFAENEKWGYKDDAGKIVIKPQYDDARDFAFGLAAVNIGAKLDNSIVRIKDGGKWGYINAKGEIVVPFTLKYAFEFSDGLAHVFDSNGTRFIDTKGKTVIKLEHESSAGDFREGLAPVHVDRSLKGKDWQTNYIDKNGKTVFTVDGYGEEFYEGLAVLIVRHEIDKEQKLYGYIDKKGIRVIPPRFAEAFHFSEDLAAVRTEKTTVYGMGDTWGYVNKSGEYVIKPQFNQADHFKKGSAKVHIGGKIHAVTDAPPFWEGGEWCLIDKKGNILKRSKERLEYQDSLH